MTQTCIDNKKGDMTTHDTITTCDMTQLDKITGDITLSNTMHATNQIAQQLTLHHCDIETLKGCGHAFTVLERETWKLKPGVTEAMEDPKHPRDCKGMTDKEQFLHEKQIKNCDTCKLHQKGAI